MLKGQLMQKVERKVKESAYLRLARRGWYRIVMALLVLLAMLPWHERNSLAQVEEPTQFQIQFKTRQFTPTPGLEIDAIRSGREKQGAVPAEKQATAAGQVDPAYALYLPLIASESGQPEEEQLHFLLQVETLPDADARQHFANQGIHLLTYVTSNTYIAAATLADLDHLPNLPGVRWAGPLQASDKIAPTLQAGTIGTWAQTPDGREVLTIQFHQNVGVAQAEALVTRLGGEIVSTVASVPAITAIFQPGQRQRIAQQDIVQYVDAVDLPLEAHNDGARVAANVAPLAQAPYNLTGNGVTVLVYDAGRVDATHPDFGTRIIQDDGSSVVGHATHVAGTVGGSGVNSNGNDSAGNPNGGTAGQWAGMAPAVNIRSFGSSGGDVLYDKAGDLNGDFTTAINNGIDLATMSLGNNVVRNGFPCSQLGDYTNTAILIDNIVRGSIAGQQLIYVESAGNERNGSLAACTLTFSTISSPATAKNSIVVGAVNSNDHSITNFTSFGPTDDGRIKPDITAPGCQADGDRRITSPNFIDSDFDDDFDTGEIQNAYVGECGTSMATPVVAGATALLLEQWRATRGAGTRPLPSTVKTILVHTATDRGNTGPDYQFGWGTLDAQAAVDFVIADDTANLIHVEQVDNGDTDFYTLNSDGSSTVQVTLAWDDPPATRLAATTLINNLDLRLIDPDGITYQPFTLDPTSPGNAAGNGNDTINNVEMVVGAAKAGTWTLTVAGTTVPQGPQQYTLITPTDGVLNRPPVAEAAGPYLTDEGAEIVLDGSGASDPDGDTLRYEWDFNYDGITFDVDATGVTPSFNQVGQDGVLPIAQRVTDPDGAFDIDTTTVVVNNVPPTVLLTPNDLEQEGAIVTINGMVTDPGWLESLTATINWGDGTSVESISGTLENVQPDATLTLAPTHVYADNGSYTVEICGADDDSTTCDSSTILVNNVSPTVAAGEDQIIYEGDTAVLDPATFNDKGALDTHVATIDWGDGSASDAGTVNESPFGPPGSINGASGTVASQHPYMGAPGVYTVTVTVTDKDGGVGTDTLNITVVPGFFRFCAYADETQEDSSLSLIAKLATLECARVIGGAPGKTRAGGVGSRSSLEAEDHALIQGDMVSLQGEIVLKGDSILSGNIVSLDDVELEDYAQAEGHVTTAGSILLKNHSVVTGDANASGDIQLQEQSVIRGAINAFTTVPPLAQITPVQFALSAGTQDVTVEKETQLALDPGSYRDVAIGTDATLTLRAGRYTFRQFETTRAAIVAFDLADGPIVIDVVNNVAFAEQAQMIIGSTTGDAADILFRVGGDQIYLAEEGVYLGTFLGLDTKAKLGQNATLTGALYGEQVEIRERTHVVGRPAVKVYAAMFSVPNP